jgi:hypothetical protein
MNYDGKLKLRLHNTTCCLIEVVTKAGLTVDVAWCVLVTVKPSLLATSIKLQSNLLYWPPLLSYSQTFFSDHLY